MQSKASKASKQASNASKASIAICFCVLRAQRQDFFLRFARAAPRHCLHVARAARTKNAFCARSAKKFVCVLRARRQDIVCTLPAQCEQKIPFARAARRNLFAFCARGANTLFALCTSSANKESMSRAQREENVFAFCTRGAKTLFALCPRSANRKYLLRAQREEFFFLRFARAAPIHCLHFARAARTKNAFCARSAKKFFCELLLLRLFFFFLLFLLPVSLWAGARAKFVVYLFWVCRAFFFVFTVYFPLRGGAGKICCVPSFGFARSESQLPAYYSNYKNPSRQSLIREKIERKRKRTRTHQQ